MKKNRSVSSIAVSKVEKSGGLPAIKTLNLHNRKKEVLRIDTENKRLVEKLKSI